MSELDLGAYLARIGLDGAFEPSAATLNLLHVAHLRHIPFENLDVRLGRAIRLDVPSLQEKLVHARRGGYCFEQNTLFAAALLALGFTVDALEARVRPPDVSAALPRTHMALRVQADGRSWLADVGFGGDGPIKPVALQDEAIDPEDVAYRVVKESEDIRVLQIRAPGGWRDLYAFSLTPALAVDLEVANHFTSTHPRSIFVRTLTVQLSRIEARHMLRGQSYSVRSTNGELTRELTIESLPDLLRETFGIEVPATDVLRAASSSD